MILTKVKESNTDDMDFGHGCFGFLVKKENTAFYKIHFAGGMNFCGSNCFYLHYLHAMEFYKLTDFQLYSIIHSRHLDKESREQAEREFTRRNLPEEEIEKLKAELAEKTKTALSSFTVSPNVLFLLGAIILLFLLRECVFVR